MPVGPALMRLLVQPDDRVASVVRLVRARLSDSLTICRFEVRVFEQR